MTNNIKKLTTEEIANTLKTSMIGYGNLTNNANKTDKEIIFILNNLHHLKDLKAYSNIQTSKGLNRGLIGEEITKAIYKSNRKDFSKAYKTDMKKGNKNYEIKTLINPSNLPRITDKQLNENDEVIALTLEGFYRISTDTIRELLNQSRSDLFQYDKGNKGTRLKMKLFKDYGVKDEEHTKELTLIERI